MFMDFQSFISILITALEVVFVGLLLKLYIYLRSSDDSNTLKAS